MSSDYDASDWSEDFSPVDSLDHRNACPVPIKKAQPATKPKRHELPKGDLHSHLKPLPKGYRLADERYMTKYRKANQTRSLTAALEKRKAREPIPQPADAGRAANDYSRLEEIAQRWEAGSDALLFFPMYEVLPAWDTRAWEVELRAAVNWFVDAFGGPEHGDEKHWREIREGFKAIQDAYFGNDPKDGWDWSYQVPEWEDMEPRDFHTARRWCSPHLPPTIAATMLTARSEAEVAWEAAQPGGLEAVADL